MARALGGRAGGDPAPVHRDAMRVVMFSDAVFAITVTLLVLEIRPPTDDSDLLHGLLALWPSYLAYAVTFLFIGQVWANHHVMFDHIRIADRSVLLLNTLLLMVVAFLPFATSVLAGALLQRTRAANRRGLLRHRVRRNGPDLQRSLAVRAASPAAQRSPWLCRRDSISRRFQLAVVWLATGALLGFVLPVLGVAVIVAFNAYYWLPIRGESPRLEP